MFSWATLNWTFGAGRGLSTAILAGTAVLLTGVAQADGFTQTFSGDNDLSFRSIRFSPDGSADFYEACTVEIESFPVSTLGSTEVSLTGNGFSKIQPGFAVEFFGTRYDSVYIGANGYVTLGFGDVASDGTPANHFNLPRVSGFYADLNPSLGGTISYEVIGTKLVVTFRNVVMDADVNKKVNFQVELYSSGGIVLSWLNLPSAPMLAGISQGNGVPGGFVNSDLSAYGACESPCLSANIEAADQLADIYSSPPLNFPVDEMDLDINGIPDVLNLRLLEETIRRGSAFGHCQALAAWEANIAILEPKIALLPGNFFTQWTRQDFLVACAGIATIGNDRFPQNLVRLLGSTQSLGIARGELNGTAEPYVSWSGDMDRDGVCNRGEYEAAESFEAFLAAAFDPNIAEDGGQCFTEYFEFPDEEGEGDSGEGEPGGVLCEVEVSGAAMVPANSSPYVGTVEFTDLGEQVLVTVTHNVPLPAQTVVFRGQPGQVGVPFIGLGVGPSPSVSLISKAALDIISTGYYVQIIHQGNQGFVDIRGQIECRPGSEEGEGVLEGEGTIDGEGSVEGVQEGAAEGQPEGEGEGQEGAQEGALEGEGQPEGDPEPFTSCLADLSGSLAVPPRVTSYAGVLVLSNLGDTAQILIFHNIPEPTFGAVHLGGPGEIGPKLFDLSTLASPIVIELPLENVAEVTRGSYVRLGYPGFAPGEIRGDLTCTYTGEGGNEGQTDEFHTADYVGPDGVIELTELLRVVQLFNVGEFGCGTSEDGYELGSIDRTCAPADFDYSPQNWRVDLTEVLRLVQFYNARGYVGGQPTEDGYAPAEDTTIN